MSDHTPHAELVLTIAPAMPTNSPGRPSTKAVNASGGTGAVLGLVPFATGNGLKRCLGIPRLGQHAYDTVRRGRVRAIGTGAANKILFSNVMGMGFDVEISRHSNQLAQHGLSS